MKESKGTNDNILKVLYEETGKMMRFYLTWRQLMLAGFFAIIAALSLGFKWSIKEAQYLSFIFPFTGVAVGLLFWALDRRNRQLYQHTAEAGRELEKKMGFKDIGYFGSYKKEKNNLSHSRILTVLYMGFTAIMVIGGIIIL